MSEHVLDWIPAYHDDELAAERRAEVEAHLAECAACRLELEALRALSTLLQAGAPAEALASSPAAGAAERTFTGQVLRRLPQPQRPFWPRAVYFAWRYTPLALFAAWAFFQAVLWVSGGLLLALSAAPGAWSLLPLDGSANMNLLARLAEGLLPLPALVELPEQIGLSWLGPLVLINAVVAALLAALFLAWLASLWAYQKKMVPVP